MKAIDEGLRKRIYALLGLFVLVVLALMAGLYQHQVTRQERYLTWADRQQLQPIRLIPLRGKILDCRGAPMAVSLEGGSLFSHPASVEDPALTARQLAPYLEMDARDLRAKLKRSLSFVWLARQLPLKKARDAQKIGLSGIGMEKEGIRYYPNRDLAANVIGFVGVDSQGLEGLELYYEGHVRGAQASLLLQRDARGRLLWREMAEAPDLGRGSEIALTLDLRIQFAAERTLRQAVEETGASSGSVVVLDPRSGEILAMACVPTFNPNNYQDYRPDWRRNRCITDIFEPGSTVKPFLLAAAIEEGLVSEQTKFHCEEGAYRFGGHWIHDMKPHEELTALEVITHSSNIGATKIAERLEAQTWWEYLHAFGFGQETGVDLPGEVSGSLRPWRRWAKVALATHAFGHGFSVTTLQMATAFAALANGGFLLEPFVVREVRDETGRPVEVRRPRVVRRVISKETAERVLAVLEVVVASGTGSKGQVPGFRVAGKTGTAMRFDQETGRYEHERPVVSFVGVVPVDRPELVIAVVLNEPEGQATGGKMAAPVFREIAASSLHYRQVQGDVSAIAEAGYAVRYCSTNQIQGVSLSQGLGAARTGPPGAWLMPDLRSLPFRTALRALEGLPVTIRVEGSGRILKQDPLPGASILAHQSIRLAGLSDGRTGSAREGTGKE
jgi:cell division protein FtsI (penicillin-binding protein 3)